MNVTRISCLFLVGCMGTITGCPSAPAGRYQIHVEHSPTGTVTHLVDSKHNEVVLYIAELDQNPPTITVLPVSALDVKSVSVDSIGDEGVLIFSNEKPEMNTFAISVDSAKFPGALVLNGFDSNKDGLPDMRSLRMRTDTGYMEYFDLDANGTLDGRWEIHLDGTTPQAVHILAGQTWVPVEGDKSVFLFTMHTATSRTTPAIVYQFQEGLWQEPTESAGN